MSLLFEGIVQEDINTGTSTGVEIDSPTGGVILGTQIGIHSIAVGQVSWTETWNPNSIAAGSYESEDVTVPGAAANDFCIASLSSLLANEMMLTAHVSAADTVKVILFNPTAGAINVGSGTLAVLVFKSR